VYSLLAGLALAAVPRTDQPVYEFACHEGNYGLKNILGAARVLELEGAQSQ
jgi:hypothetical protein